MTDTTIMVPVEMTPDFWINLIESNIRASLEFSSGDYFDGAEKKLSAAFKEKIQEIGEPIEKFAEKKDFDLKDLKKCRDLLSEFILKVENMKE